MTEQYLIADLTVQGERSCGAFRLFYVLKMASSNPRPPHTHVDKSTQVTQYQLQVEHPRLGKSSMCANSIWEHLTNSIQPFQSVNSSMDCRYSFPELSVKV